MLFHSAKKAMAPHSSALAWKIPWTEDPDGLQFIRSRTVDTTERLHFHFSLSCIGEGNGNPLQCSCLENPRDKGEPSGLPSMGSHRGTRLKRLSSSSSSSILLRDGVIIRRKKVFVVLTFSLGLCLLIKMFHSPRKVNKIVKIFLLSFFAFALFAFSFLCFSQLTYKWVLQGLLHNKYFSIC